MKTISCKDMGVDCPWVGRAKTIDELVRQSKDHAKKHHREYWEKTMKNMSDDEIREEVEKFAKEG